MATTPLLPLPNRDAAEFVERELMRVERDLQVLLGAMQTKRTRTLGEDLSQRLGRVRRSVEELVGRHFSGDTPGSRVVELLKWKYSRSRLAEIVPDVEAACQTLGELRVYYSQRRLKDLQQKVQQLQFTIDAANKTRNDGKDSAGQVKPSALAKASSIFVIMPFNESFSDVWAGAIQRAARSAGFEPIRVDMINRSSDITDDIIEAIGSCHAAIVDVTGANANVMFELGYAFAKDKPQIIVSQSTDYLPFDIRNLRTVVYQNTWAGIEELSVRLTEFLRELPRPKSRTRGQRRRRVRLTQASNRLNNDDSVGVEN